MKVLFLTNIPAPYRVDFFYELGKLCDLTVLYELGSASDRNIKWKSSSSKNFKEIFLKGKRLSADSAICFSVIKYLKDTSYDIIVVGGYSTPTGMLAIQYLKLKNRKFILNSDGGLIKECSGIKYKIKKYFISSAIAWLSTGESTNRYLLNYGADKNKIYIYPFSSIKDEDILDEPLTNEEKILIKKTLGVREQKIIISVGQFIYRKGFDILISAMKYIEGDIGVYIIGGEPTEEYLELKDKYNLNNLHFEGFKTKEELKEYFKMSDLFVLPTREDIWGLVINEAMAYGLPVITTDRCVAGLELLNENECGQIIEANNVEMLSDSIGKFLQSYDDSKIISEKILKAAKKYTIENMASAHYNIFRKILYKN